MKRSEGTSTLRTIAMAVLYVGGAASLFLTVYNGRHNSAVILIVLFAGWVLSPFLALLVADARARGWSPQTQRLIYWLILMITPLSLIFYSHLVEPAGVKPAFVFLIIPLASWVVMAISFLTIRLLSGPTKK